MDKISCKVKRITEKMLTGNYVPTADDINEVFDLYVSIVIEVAD